MEGVTSLIEIDSEGKNRSSRIRYYSYPTLPLEPMQSKSHPDGGRRGSLDAYVRVGKGRCVWAPGTESAPTTWPIATRLVICVSSTTDYL